MERNKFVPISSLFISFIVVNFQQVKLHLKSKCKSKKFYTIRNISLFVVTRSKWKHFWRIHACIWRLDIRNHFKLNWNEMEWHGLHISINFVVSECAALRFPFYSSDAADSSSACSRCGNLGCFRRDETFFVFGFGVVVGGFSNSSNCLSVKMPLYQSALEWYRKNFSFNSELKEK